MQMRKLALGLGPALVLTGAAFAGGTSYSDNFDSYTSGNGVVGMNGWESWCGTFEDALASNAHSNSAPNSMHVDSFDDVVQDVDETVLTSGVWELNFNHFVETNATGSTYIIGLNAYCNTTNNWSLQVNFNATTDQVVCEGGNAESTTLVRNQWVPVRVVIDLDNDTHDIYYNGTLVVDDRSWSGGVSGGGIAAISCFDYFSNGAAEGSYYDDATFGPSNTGPTPGTVTDASIVFGIDVDGGGIVVANITDDDNVVERVRSRPGINVIEPDYCEIRYNGTTGGTSLHSVLSRENCNANPAVAKVKAFNYNTNQLNDVGQYNMTFGNGSGNDTEHTVNVGSTNFVSGAGVFRVHIRFVAIAVFSAQGMDVWQDQFVAFFE